MVGEPESSFDTLRIFYLIALALAWQKLDPADLIAYWISKSVEPHWVSCVKVGACIVRLGLQMKMKWKLLGRISWPQVPGPPDLAETPWPAETSSPPGVEPHLVLLGDRVVSLLRCLPSMGIPVLCWMAGPTLSWNGVKQRSNYLLLMDAQK